ncbi:MAG: GntR family transcriptional regulator [Mycobacterium sp.]|nr:GntR family transcriptional regulator [Mycobacterium sp.]
MASRSGRDAPASTSGTSTASLYAAIHRQIVDGSLGPGSLLIEAELSAAHHVSRTPVRDALARLEHDGLLDRTARGYTVLQRSPEEVVELFEARIVLELAVAEKAAERRSVLDLARLSHLLERAESCDDRSEQIELNTSFHVALREAAHNRAFVELMQRLDAQLAVYDSRVPADDREPTLKEHRCILDAVGASDTNAARELMAAHANRSRDLRITALARGE